ncbi:unnamed protein product [Colias eurytheme]|nr:unnamed protein product [Colias eurytheme]
MAIMAIYGPLLRKTRPSSRVEPLSDFHVGPINVRIRVQLTPIGTCIPIRHPEGCNKICILLIKGRVAEKFANIGPP